MVFLKEYEKVFLRVDVLVDMTAALLVENSVGLLDD